MKYILSLLSVTILLLSSCGTSPEIENPTLETNEPENIVENVTLDYE